MRRGLRLGLALLLALAATVTSHAGENLDAANWNTLRKRFDDVMKTPGRAAEKEEVALALGSDDSVRAAQILVRWALHSEKWQETELDAELKRREEEKQKLEKLLLKAYPSLPPTQAEHLSAWNKANELFTAASDAWTAEARAQSAITAAMQSLRDPAAVAWVAADGVRATRGVKYGEPAFLSVVKCVLRNRTSEDPRAAIDWARPANPRDVRVLALTWIAEQRPATGYEAALEALADTAIVVRRAAVAALVGIDDPRAVKPLIDALAGAGGLLADEIDAALHTFTGQTFEGDAKIWLRWWTEHGPAWLQGASSARHDRAERKSGGGSSFYGVQTKSERIVFVLDRSGSMKEKAGESSRPRGPVTGQGKDEAPVQGETKLEVAKNQLARSVDALAPGVVFNVVFYGTDVQVWKPPPQLLPARPAEKEAAKKWFGGLTPEGSTNLFGALRKALEYAATDGKGGGGADTIFLLSDGAPTSGKGEMSREDIDREMEAFFDANRSARCVVHTIGVGPDHSVWLMERIATATGGRYVAVGAD